MGKGGYTGGSTIIGRNSGWFTNTGYVPCPKPITTKQLAKKAKKDAKAAAKKQAEQDAYFALIQGMPSTIGQAVKARKKRKKSKKANTAQQR